MIPLIILQVWLLALSSVAIAGGAVYLAHRWQQRSWSWDPALSQPVFTPDLSSPTGLALLGSAIVLGVVTIAGGRILGMVLRRSSRRPPPAETDPRENPVATSSRQLSRPDGSVLQVSFFGSPDAPPLVLTHGWGLCGTAWNELIRDLSGRFRLVTWDEPGLGRSTRPGNRDYSLENLATHLHAVLAVTGDRPAILVGHSIGGMIILTFCRLFPDALAGRVAGLVLAHTTPDNPVRTTSGAGFLAKIEKPVLVPLMHLTIALSPLFRLFSWLSFFNGSAHWMTRRSSFGGTESWQQLDFATRFQPRASPAVFARGMLAMMRYRATDVLGQIRVPTLVVAGDLDPVTKPAASEQIRAGIAGARLVTLSPAKHLGLIEHHAKFAELVANFADEVLFDPRVKATRFHDDGKPAGVNAIQLPAAARQGETASDSLPA